MQQNLTSHVTNRLHDRRHKTVVWYNEIRVTEKNMSLVMRWKLMFVVLMALVGLTCGQRQLGKLMDTIELSQQRVCNICKFVRQSM